MPNENQISRNPAGNVGCRQSRLPQGDECLLHSTPATLAHTYSRLLQRSVNTFTCPQCLSHHVVPWGKWKMPLRMSWKSIMTIRKLSTSRIRPPPPSVPPCSLRPKYSQHFININVLRAKLMAWLSVHANSCEQICIFHIYLPAACCHLRLKRQVSSGRGGLVKWQSNENTTVFYLYIKLLAHTHSQT